MNPNEKRILVVDDFEMVRTMLKSCLATLGAFTVDEATNGKVALERMREALASRNPYSLVFLDLNMPEMNGFEVIETCSADPTLRKTPIVVISAESEGDDVTRTLESGAIDYIFKPFSKEVLRTRVQEILEKNTN